MFYEADKVKDGRTAKYIPQLARFPILFLPKCLAISFILNAECGPLAHYFYKNTYFLCLIDVRLGKV